MRWLALLFVLVPAFAFAQDKPFASPTDGLHLAEPANIGTTAGNPDPDCDAWRPPYPTVGATLTGPTFLSAHISLTGTVGGAAVVQSSGDPLFDRGALACAPHMHFSVPSSGGKLIELDWQIAVEWRLAPPERRLGPHHAYYFIPEWRGPTACRYPEQSVRRHETGSTTVAYRIVSDGSVVDVSVTQSSGSAELDDATLTCVKSARFPPWRSDAAAPTGLDKTASMSYNLSP